jgi:hypothetical protein
MSGVPGIPVFVKRHNSRVAFQPVRLFGDPVLPARAAQVVPEPVVKLRPHPVRGKVR